MKLFTINSNFLFVVVCSFIFVISLAIVQVSYGSIVPDLDIEVDKLKEDLKDLSNKDIREIFNKGQNKDSNDWDGQGSTDAHATINPAPDLEFSAQNSDDLCEVDYCVKRGESLEIKLTCGGTHPGMIVTCVMINGPKGSKFVSSNGNSVEGTMTWKSPNPPGSYEASFQSKVLFCPPELPSCIDSPILLLKINVDKSQCNSKNNVRYFSDLDPLWIDQIFGTSAIISLAQVKDAHFTINGEILDGLWAFTESKDPRVHWKIDPKSKTVDCGTFTYIEIIKHFPILEPVILDAHLSISERNEWNRFIKALHFHEDNHIKIIKEGYQGLGGFNGITNEIIGKDQQTAINLILQRENETQAAHEQYDTDTNHGINEFTPYGPAELNTEIH
ncbi:MAG: DUF922 domain-containing protein [Candidatus Nitrosocosmicus sp.]